MSLQQTKNKKETPLPFYVELCVAGVCGSAAWLLAHPFELFKNHTILSHDNNSLAVAYKEVSAARGGIWRGLDAGLLRQISYTSFRIGFYKPILDALVVTRRRRRHGGGEGEGVTAIDRMVAGATAGMVASFLSSPVEVALVLQSKKATDKKQPRLSVGQSMLQIYRQSGIGGFWRGAVPLMSRAAIVGISQVAFFDQTRHFLKESYPNWNHGWHTVLASIATGIFYAGVTMPMETSRVLLSAQQGAKQQYYYHNMMHCIVTIAKERGVSALYQAYVPYMLRCTVHSVFVFLFIDYTRKLLLRDNKAPPGSGATIS